MNYKINNSEPEYLKSSNILFVVTGLKLLTFIISAILFPIGIFGSILSIFSIVLTLAIWGGLAVVVRNRTDWAKYVLAVLASLSFVSSVGSLFGIMEFPVIIILGFITTGLVIWATLLLFKKELGRF